jgi:hypothetical protein
LEAVVLLRGQVELLHALQGRRHERWPGAVDAETLGWLCAWAAGLSEAKPGLRAHLTAAGHPRAAHTYALEDHEVGEALRRLTAEE